jgi:hypothetical protein
MSATRSSINDRCKVFRDPVPELIGIESGDVFLLGLSAPPSRKAGGSGLPSAKRADLSACIARPGLAASMEVPKAVGGMSQE